MNRFIPLAVCLMLLVIAAAPAIAASSRASTAEQDPKGKTCRMEQQCRWENFKKICTWVKVCH